MKGLGIKMENDIILKEYDEKAVLCDKAISKMSGEQILTLAALGVGGVLSLVGILCLGGYDFKVNKDGMSFIKHDVNISKKAA